jgi:sortase (surface protein transpeptidase)
MSMKDGHIHWPAPTVVITRAQLALFLIIVLACNGAQWADPMRFAAHNVLLPAATDPALAQAEARYRPVRLEIPRLKMKAPIIPVGTDAGGAMLAPTDAPTTDPIWGEVYWWDGGAFPGQVGSAVIAGHVNRPDPRPAPFTSLNELAVGDVILVLTANHEALAFVVTGTAALSAYAHGSADPIITRIFGPTLKPILHLITCAGRYDGKTFDHRLVITATLAEPSPFPTE